MPVCRSHISWFLISALAALITLPGEARACICAKEPRQQVMDDADVVFIGVPVEIDETEEDGFTWRKTTFRVDQWIKGGEKGGKTAEIVIRRSSCDVQFRVGNKAFTIAAFVDEKGRFTTNRCVMLNIHREQ